MTAPYVYPWLLDKPCQVNMARMEHETEAGGDACWRCGEPLPEFLRGAMAEAEAERKRERSDFERAMDDAREAAQPLADGVLTLWRDAVDAFRRVLRATTRR